MHDPWARYPPRSPDRISETLAEVERVWRAWPDLRLSQLILNLERDEVRLYNMEEKQLVERLREIYPER